MTDFETMPEENEMRRAVENRDPAYDRRFVYAVVTTGVACRPSCAARPARPENLRFFADLESAITSGFRPCKRCRPDEQLSRHERFVAVARYIEANFENSLTLKFLGHQFDIPPTQLQRGFKDVLGVSPRAYQDELKTKRFRTLLKSGDKVSGAAYEAGFGSTSRVYGKAARNVGMTPSAYRSGGAGETLHYACRDTVLGPMLMAATRLGICFAQFGDSEQELCETLQQEFPKATLVSSVAGESTELNDWIDALNEHLTSSSPRPDLPLDLRGTAFQIMVWQFLLGTSDGDVVSYGEVASGVGRPRAVRAAASACGANKIAVLVPCHRVLRGDGNIGGYRWGVERKRALLDDERQRRSAR